MNICSESEYRQFVGNISDLCVEGFVSADYCEMFGIDYEASRARLLDSYHEFAVCCEWLSGCRLSDYATHFSPDSLRIKEKVEASSGQSVSNGSLIVAVKYLDLPHVTLSNTPNIFVGISRFCKRFHSFANYTA